MALLDLLHAIAPQNGQPGHLLPPQNALQLLFQGMFNRGQQAPTQPQPLPPSSLIGLLQSRGINSRPTPFGRTPFAPQQSPPGQPSQYPPVTLKL